MFRLNLKITLIICCLLSTEVLKAQFTMPAFQATQYAGTPIKVTTTVKSNVELTTANSGGVITGTSGAITSRGICWSTNANPTIANSRTLNGAGTGVFNSKLYGLASDQLYYVRAYAVNSGGTVFYGQNETLTTDKTVGYLNYATYAVSSADVNNTSQMNSQISNAGTAFDSGVALASTVIDYSSYTKLTAAGIGVPNDFDNFILVASGKFVPTIRGKYTFTCEGDDAVDLYIDGKLVASQYGQNSEAALGQHKGTTATLVKGREYSFQARMKENSGNEALRVFWQKPGSNTYVQDPTELRPFSEITADPDGKLYYDGDGVLNYKVYTNVSSPNSTAQMDNLFNTATVFDSGSSNASTLINFSLYTELTALGLKIPNGGDNFALSASGYFIPSETGTYTFTCEGDDAVDFRINDNVIVSHYGDHPASSLGTHTGTINLVAGVRYPIEARMQETGGEEVLMVFWRKPSQTGGWHQDFGEISSN